MWWPSQLLPRNPAYDVKAHRAKVQKLYEAYPLLTREACDNHTIELLKRIPYVPLRFILPIRDCIDQLYRQNDYYLINEGIGENPHSLERLEKLLSLDRLNAADSALVAFFTQFIAASPKEADVDPEDTSPITPLVDCLPYPYRLIQMCVLLRDLDLFPDLDNQIFRNIVIASGHNPATYRDQKLKNLDDYGSPTATVENVLIHTPLLQLFAVPIPFGIKPETWSSHGIILAPPNHGKSQLIGTLITTFLKDGIAPIVLDPHGDLFELLADRIPDAIILDPDTNPPALNFFDYGNLSHVDTLTTFSFLMSALSGGLSDKQGGIVPYLLKLLRCIPNASLETLRQLIDEKPKNLDTSVFAPFIKALPVVDQGFFKNQFFTHTMQATKDAIGWKLYNALASDAFREMFSAPTNSFDADAALRHRRTVLVKGGRRSLGQHGMEVYLQFITSLFFSAALRREIIPIEKRTLSVLVVDEAHHVFNPQISNILTECRKYRLGFLGATQLVEQIPQEVKAAIYGATAIRFAGPISSNDAGILAREMYTTPDFIRSMVAVERSHAEWACHVRGQNQCLKLTVPYGAVEAMPVVPRRQVPPRSKPATTERTVNAAAPSATPPPLPEQPDTSASPDDLDKDRWS